MSERENPEVPDGIDGMDALLRDSLAAAPPPALPPTFTESVTQRVRPRPLPPSARRTLRLYAFAATALSLGVMASLGVPWRFIVAALAVSAAIALLIWKRLP